MVREFDELLKAIYNDEISISNFHYDDEFIHAGGTYVANGTVKYKGKTYGFLWNHDEGIIDSTIEEETH